MIDRYRVELKEKPMGSEKGRRLRSLMTLPRRDGKGEDPGKTLQGYCTNVQEVIV
jgi:hypothetical protein